MAQYRVLFLDEHGRVAQAPEVIECADDKAAIEKAIQLLEGRLVEVWQEGRLVIRLAPPQRW
jgi:hypothetical protein